MKLQTLARLVKSLTNDELAEAAAIGLQQHQAGELAMAERTLAIVEMFIALRERLNATLPAETATRGARSEPGATKPTRQADRA